MGFSRKIVIDSRAHVARLKLSITIDFTTECQCTLVAIVSQSLTFRKKMGFSRKIVIDSRAHVARLKLSITIDFTRQLKGDVL